MHRQICAVVLIALLAALSVVVPFVNADAGPPRALFLQLPPDRPEPSITLHALRDADGGWTLEIAAERFQFTALCRTGAAAAPVGHAHVFRAEAKIATAYAPVVDLGHLPPGTHRIRVVLRGQDHRVLVGRDGLIEAEVTITVPAAVNL